MGKFIFIFMAFVAGALLPVQAAFNARMGKISGSPMIAAFVSFAVGTIALLIYLLISKQQVSFADTAKATPWYVWFAGILGCFYVASSVMLLPRLGVALTFGLVIFGQLIVALIIDHYGLFGAVIKTINVYRILGVILLVSGVILIRKF